MDCVLVKTEQGTEEWAKLRRGRLTASHAGDWLAKPTTKGYQSYMTQIILELLGYEDEEQDAPWFAHGKAMEPYARGAYQWKTDQKVTADVFLIHKDFDWLGASPDGIFLPDKDGMVEIKCRAKLTTYQDKVAEQLRTGLIESVYRPQLQCQMLVSGLQQIEFLNYFHDDQQMVRKLHIFTVERDDEMCDRILERGFEFMTECYKEAGIKNEKMRRP